MSELDTDTFWQQKWEKEYNNCYLVKNWTYRDNCLAREKKTFDLLIIQYGYYEFAQQSKIYEHGKMSHSIVKEINWSNIIKSDCYTRLIEFELDERFILIMFNFETDKHHVVNTFDDEQ